MKFGCFALLILFTACTPDRPPRTEPDTVAVENSTETKQLESARVIGVIDGDTIDVLLAGNVQQRIRLNGIDTPERGQPFVQKHPTYGEKGLLRATRQQIFNQFRNLIF